VSGYVVDDLALSAGLVGTGSEHQRRELSRLLRGAIDGCPTLDVSALCLAEVTAARGRDRCRAPASGRLAVLRARWQLWSSPNDMPPRGGRGPRPPRHLLD
jgi:hypothetical protein